MTLGCTIGKLQLPFPNGPKVPQPNCCGRCDTVLDTGQRHHMWRRAQIWDYHALHRTGLKADFLFANSSTGVPHRRRHFQIFGISVSRRQLTKTYNIPRRYHCGPLHAQERRLEAVFSASTYLSGYFDTGGAPNFLGSWEQPERIPGKC